MLILSDEPEATRLPLVNYGLIAINVLVFLVVLVHCDAQELYFKQCGVVPARFLAHPDLTEFGTVLTSMFMHAGFGHIISNMWFLYIFGDNIEDAFGHFGYLLFFLICGVGCAAGHIFTNQYSMLPCVGASGAISGVMASYLLLYPEATCKVWWGDDFIFFAFRTHRVRARIIITLWFIFQIISSFLGAGSVAVMGHIGGFITGLILTLIFQNKTSGGPRFTDKNRAVMAGSILVLGVISFYTNFQMMTTAKAKAAAPVAIASKKVTTPKAKHSGSKSTHKALKSVRHRIVLPPHSVSSRSTGGLE